MYALCAKILEQSLWARNQVGTELSNVVWRHSTTTLSYSVPSPPIDCSKIPPLVLSLHRPQPCIIYMYVQCTMYIFVHRYLWVLVFSKGLIWHDCLNSYTISCSTQGPLNFTESVKSRHLISKTIQINLCVSFDHTFDTL